MKDLTIVLPIFELNIDIVTKCLLHYKKLFLESNLLIFDSGGGGTLKDYASYYEFNEFLTLEQARLKGISMAKTEFTFCLDVDTLVPEGYVEQAIKILSERQDVAVVALDFENIQGHLVFGTSIWKTPVLFRLYNWQYKLHRFCECFYMWTRVHEVKLKIETLPMRAMHLKKT